MNNAIREIRDPDRTRKIFRFQPTLPAADHAAEQDVLLARNQPSANFRAQSFCEISVIDAKNALRRGTPRQDSSICIEPKRTEIAGTPIHCNQGLSSWDFSPQRMRPLCQIRCAHWNACVLERISYCYPAPILDTSGFSLRKSRAIRGGFGAHP
jgi:hypothetical protein